ncbi:MAG: F0F1 ATP synthase subunit B [Saprospiraceae bacterium]
MINLFLADFSVIKPDPGLLFWTLLIFLLVWGLLGRTAFGPIQKALRKRNSDIQESIDEAKRVRAEMEKLSSDNRQMLAEAREERTRIIRQAETEAVSIVDASKEDAKTAARKIAADTQRDIENMRQAAITDLKKQVGTMAVDIAEQILRKQLDAKTEQEDYVQTLVNNMN